MWRISWCFAESCLAATSDRRRQCPVGLISVIELQGELKRSRIVRAGHRAEVVVDYPAIGEVDKGAHVAELRVIPRIEALRPKFQTCPAIVQFEVLKQGQVPVVSAGAAERVVSQVPEFTRSGGSKARRAEPVIGALRIMGRPAEIRPVETGESITDVPLRAVIENSSFPYRERHSGLHRHYS